MIRVLIADGHKMFRQGVARLIADVDDIVVAAEVQDDAGVLQALKSHRTDVGVFAQSLPERGGISLIKHAKALQPAFRALLISPRVQDPYLLPALHAGADGYITKEDAAEELLAAIRRLAAGGRYICPAVAERQTFDFFGTDAGQPDHMRLSSREFEVFRLLVAGKRGAEIAAELALSDKTVSSHKASVLRKLNLVGIAELVRYAIKHDLLPH